jgi:outer membrane lipase/esterase
MNRIGKLAAALALAGLAQLASAASYTGLYIFGDSLSDTGNVAALIGADPTQVISGNTYIPDRPYASNQFTNGDVWAKTFASAIGLAPYATAAKLGGGDFAFGGARVNTDNPGVLPPSLAAQTSLYLAATGNHAQSGALYVVAGGGNDARDALALAATSAKPVDVIAAAAAKYAKDTGDIVDRLQAAGAQHIIVWDVPNLGVVPAVTAQGAGASFLGGLTSSFMSGALAARMSGESGVTLFDAFGLLTQAALNPAAFGLSNVKDACGSPLKGCDPATSLFWDGIHPTATVHAILAQQMVLTAVPEPGTWAMLAAGLLLVGLRARRAHTAAA